MLDGAKMEQAMMTMIHLRRIYICLFPDSRGVRSLCLIYFSHIFLVATLLGGSGYVAVIIATQVVVLTEYI